MRDPILVRLCQVRTELRESLGDSAEGVVLLSKLSSAIADLRRLTVQIEKQIVPDVDGLHPPMNDLLETWQRMLDVTGKPAPKGSALPTGGDLVGKCLNDAIVTMQAAWIEWRRGHGAQSAMLWVEGFLDKAENIPEEKEPWSDDAQAWWSANNADPFPTCFCGRPSNQLWMHQGFCSHAHFEQGKAERERQDQVLKDAAAAAEQAE